MGRIVNVLVFWRGLEYCRDAWISAGQRRYSKARKREDGFVGERRVSEMEEVEVDLVADYKRKHGDMLPRQRRCPT